MEMKHNPQYAGNSWTSFAKIVRASSSWIFTQPHKTYYNRHHHPILQFTSVLWNPFSVVFVMIMFPFVIYKALLLKPLVVAQFLGGPLLPHLLQTPEIRKLLFVPLIRIIILKKSYSHNNSQRKSYSHNNSKTSYSNNISKKISLFLLFAK